MQLSHYGIGIVTATYSLSQNEPVSCYDKPNGLWVSVDGPDD